ncbi:hypothetical protein [Thiohalophilus thiocyanatoxydans]|uniref:Uncharacterized protein n=1 Tax=Thiohalophilus thiocyanatoxydans TaxID=381308 RepID=A0A4R8IWH2_9GAMM|nr:hypothetical protein [Thiohalophilus thiocyanatoxydans]TDY03860.1 hypothetical protein EDC23_0231 [Thiohalophilus thiocyanatoxydans]
MRQNAALSASDDLELRKQAIMIGLSHFMSADECLTAVRHWEQHFSRAPRFALQAYVKELIQPDSPLWPYRKEMFLNITRTMTLPRQEIEARFATLFAAEIVPGDNTQAVQQSEAQPVFEQLYRVLMQKLETESYPSALALRKFLREKILQQEPFSMETQRLNNWLLGIKPELDGVLTLQQMRHIVHELWRGSCEYLGPVKTDRMFAEAIGKVEKKTRGEGVSPRVFL